MRRVDEPRQSFRAAVDRVRCVRIEPVVPPAAIAGEGRHRHQLDRRDAELPQPGEARDHAVERSLPRERAHVKLVQDELLQHERRPRLDLEGAQVEDSGRAVDALRLPARARVRPGVAVEHEAVVVAGSSGRLAFPDAVFRLGQRLIAACEAHRHQACLRSPRAKRNDSGLDRNSAEGRLRSERHC